MMPRFHASAFAHLSDFGRSGEPEIDRETQIKSAYDDGYQQGMADGRAEARADCELRMTEAGLLFETQRQEDRAKWNSDCADVLSATLDNAIASVVRHVEGHVATLLRPWLVEQVRRSAMDDLAKAIERALCDDVVVSIDAPAEVVADLQARLPANSFKIEYSESTSPDIRARVGDTEISANMSAWIAGLEAATS